MWSSKKQSNIFHVVNICSVTSFPVPHIRKLGEFLIDSEYATNIL